MTDSGKQLKNKKLNMNLNGIAKVTINRPEVRNAFTPNTVQEMIDAFHVLEDDHVSQLLF